MGTAPDDWVCDNHSDVKIGSIALNGVGAYRARYSGRCQHQSFQIMGQVSYLTGNGTGNIGVVTDIQGAEVGHQGSHLGG